MLITPENSEVPKRTVKLNMEINQQTVTNNGKEIILTPEDMQNGFSMPVEEAAVLPTYSSGESTASRMFPLLRSLPTRRVWPIDFAVARSSARPLCSPINGYLDALFL